jgi:hypothetical protein
MVQNSFLYQTWHSDIIMDKIQQQKYKINNFFNKESSIQNTENPILPWVELSHP